MKKTDCKQIVINLGNKIRDRLKDEVTLSDVSLDLISIASDDDEISNLIIKLNKSGKNKRILSIKNTKIEIIKHLLITHKGLIATYLISNFTTEKYTIKDCNYNLNYIGDQDYREASKMYFTAELNVDNYLLLVSINSDPIPHVFISEEGENYNITDCYNPEINVINFNPFSKTVFIYGCHEINNSKVGHLIIFDEGGK